MGKSLTFSIILILITLTMSAQDWKTPTIEGYGRITEYEEAVIKPDSTKEYKVLFHITSDKEREGVNSGLWKMARLINLLAEGGVPQEKIHVVGVISGPATLVTLTEKEYMEREEKPNPNLDLMKKLTDYGAVIHLCGQAAAEHDVDPNKDLNTYTTLTLSALIDIPYYQMQGYVVMF